jgi:peptidoglycan hydrolase CwlO-like protein
MTVKNNNDNLVDKINIFEGRHRAFLNLIVKPFGTLLVFLALGYYTMWMSTNYVKIENFTNYVNKQEALISSNFAQTQTQLQTIINQQIAFTEQLKSYNGQITGYQKTLDSLSERIIYIERNLYKNSKQNSLHPSYEN